MRNVSMCCGSMPAQSFPHAVVRLRMPSVLCVLSPPFVASSSILSLLALLVHWRRQAAAVLMSGQLADALATLVAGHMVGTTHEAQYVLSKSNHIPTGQGT